MSSVVTEFPDQTYTTSNKPSVETLKSDIAALETGHNDLQSTAVLTTGNQSVAGEKTFTSSIIGRLKPRTTTETSSATPTINTDNTDIHTITALAAAITSFTTNLSGTPVNGQKLMVRIKDDGTARAITWGASFASRGATLPTTTVLGKYTYVGLIYNSTAAVWDCVAVAEEA